MKVLVIEDNEINLRLFRDMLENAGYHVITTSNAEEGIAMAREEKPSLILMDIHLSEMDGITALRILKQDEVTRHIKVIALTSFAFKEDRERIMSAGFDGYIAKPIRYEELINAVKAFSGGEYE